MSLENSISNKKVIRNISIFTAIIHNIFEKVCLRNEKHISLIFLIKNIICMCNVHVIVRFLYIHMGSVALKVTLKHIELYISILSKQLKDIRIFFILLYLIK